MLTICTNCAHKEPRGALFCPECGAQMFENPPAPTSTGIAEAVDAPGQTPLRGRLQDEALSIRLRLVESGEVLPLGPRDEFTIGRITEGQTLIPDVDLNPFDAYNLGVSRLHASIRQSEGNFFISDLGSSNSTRVNNQVITPYTSQQIFHKDLLQLGHLKIQVLIHDEEYYNRVE